MLTSDGCLEHQTIERLSKNNHAVLVISRGPGPGSGGNCVCAGVKCRLTCLKGCQRGGVLKENNFRVCLPAKCKADVGLTHLAIADEVSLLEDLAVAAGTTNTDGAGADRGKYRIAISGIEEGLYGWINVFKGLDGPLNLAVLILFVGIVFRHHGAASGERQKENRYT